MSVVVAYSLRDAHVLQSFSLYKRANDGRTVRYDNGYEADNSYVVPYNKQLLMELDCHCNVEVCGSIKAIKYLKKYFQKGLSALSRTVFSSISLGATRSNVVVTSSNVANYDELQSYVDGRSMCSTEAAWRLFKYPMQMMSHSVCTLHIHLPGQKVVEQNSLTDGAVDGVSIPDEYELRSGIDLYVKSQLAAYFKLNQQATEYASRTGTDPSPNPLTLFYDEIPRYFTWQPSSGEWTVRKNYFNTVGRLPCPSPSQKEVFFLRLLLLRVKGATCFRDLKTYNGHVHATFGQACVARGLTVDDREWDLCLHEAAMSQMPVQLRWLFASILVHCEVKEPHLLWDKYKVCLCSSSSQFSKFSI